MPIDTRDWYREKYREEPVRRTNNSYSPSQSQPTNQEYRSYGTRRSGGSGGLARFAVVLTIAIAALLYLGLSGHLDQITIPSSLTGGPSPTAGQAGPSASAVATSPPATEPALHNPSWSQLKAFLLADKTDQVPYVYPTHVCEDFAGAIQKNAKKAGWRCAFVTIDVEGYPDWYGYGIPSNAGHALNAFETTDRGLVYIDCTGVPSGEYRSGSCDKVVSVSMGKEYQPVSLFPKPGWSSTWGAMGTVVDMHVQW